MKAKIKTEIEVELKTLVVEARVRYWEDTEVNGEPDDERGSKVPCKFGSELWTPEIDIDSGKILNWQKGVTALVHYKVCDCCGWKIKDDKGNVVLFAEDGYVPDTLSPKESGYGDYIIMEIDSNGMIKDWEFEIGDFQKESDD